MNVHFIHALGPEVVRLVEECGASTTMGRSPDPTVVIEASQVLETLLAMTAEANSELLIIFSVDGILFYNTPSLLSSTHKKVVE